MLVVLLIVALFVAVTVGVSFFKLSKRFESLKEESVEKAGIIRRLEVENGKLATELYYADSRRRKQIMADVIAWHGERLPALQAEVTKLQSSVSRLPSPSAMNRSIVTPAGLIHIEKATGYFGGLALFVYFPQGVGFSSEIARAFGQATEYKFVMEPAPPTSNGGDDCADAIISCGTDQFDRTRRYGRYIGMEQSKPDLHKVAAIFEAIVVHPAGVTALPTQ